MTNGYVQDDIYVMIPCKKLFEILKRNDAHVDTRWSRELVKQFFFILSTEKKAPRLWYKWLHCYV